jgi:hypothetical protein
VNKLTLLITLLTCFVVSSVLQGCTKESKTPQDIAKDKEFSRIEVVLNEAVSNQDFRLYGLAGRRVVLPGFESENFSQIKKRCGVRLLSRTGDVLKNNKDREERRENYQFALKINSKLYPLCLEHTAK